MENSPGIILAIVFVATVVRSTFGFGEALVSVPLLALLIPVKVAAPLAVALSVTVAGVIVIQDWRHVHLSSVIWLLAPSLVGIPTGIWMLRVLDPTTVKIGLSVVIFGFSVYVLAAKNPPKIDEGSRAITLAGGFLAGIFGGAFGMNGPPLIVYGTLRGWSPERTRATLQGYFLPASLLGVIGYGLGGLWTMRVTRLYLVALVAAIPAIFLGRFLNRKLKREAFVRWVFGGLICIAIALFAEAV